MIATASSVRTSRSSSAIDWRKMTLSFLTAAKMQILFDTMTHESVSIYQLISIKTETLLKVSVKIFATISKYSVRWLLLLKSVLKVLRYLVCSKPSHQCWHGLLPPLRDFRTGLRSQQLATATATSVQIKRATASKQVDIYIRYHQARCVPVMLFV